MAFNTKMIQLYYIYIYIYLTKKKLKPIKYGFQY